MADPADFLRREWDVLVVGTGMGGATLGYALARSGKRVLFCEMGRSLLTDGSALRGAYAETFFDRPETPKPRHRDILLRAGRYAGEVLDVSLDRPRRHVPFIGSGTGGSSALYGMALERFFPADFTPRHNYPDADESSLPENWPISYEDLKPHYEAAEKLFRVHGTLDPCRGNDSAGYLLAPAALPAGVQELYDFFQAKGLHPYRLPLACEYVPGCEGCQGYLCARECKNDSGRICLSPALEQHGAGLLDQCEVLRIEATRAAVTGVVCRWRGQELTLRAPVVVLAAGALETPRLLLNSASATWPDGLANDSGLVGRNLMRHYIDLYAVTTRTPGGKGENVKAIAFNDLYHSGGQKLGTVQSFGTMPPTSSLVAGMEEDVRHGRLPWLALPFKLAKPVLRLLLGRVFARRLVLASIVEDLPYEDNCVKLAAPGDGRLLVQYRVREHEKSRIATMRGRLADVLKPYRFLLIKQAENNERIAHACGTCRFGHDPARSVLDPHNRAHGLSNLYVVDGSFFPSSAGTNPALTIAANALRVAEHLVARGREPEDLLSLLGPPAVAARPVLGP